MEQLGINLPKFLFQLINFGIVAFLLYTWLYRPVLNMLNERSERIAKGLKDAEEANQRLANAQTEYDAEIAKARQEAAVIIQQAQERAKTQEADIIAKARTEGERLREEMREQALQERDQMLREIKDQVADLVTLTAGRVLQVELERRGHDQLIEESLTALGRQN